jgi:hypothetical protein
MNAPRDRRGYTESLWLGGLLIGLALWYGWRTYQARGAEAVASSEDEVDYLRKRALRRGGGSALMIILGLGLIVGTRLPYRGNPGQSQFFVAWWAILCLLVLALMVLAVWDMSANLSYGKRLIARLKAQRTAWLSQFNDEPDREASQQIEDVS